MVQKKLTPQVKELILAGARAYLPRDSCAGKARIGVSTLYMWLAQGQKDLDAGVDSEYTDLLEGLKQVESDNQEELLAQIRAAGRDPKTWTACAWMLERLYRQQFGNNVEQLEQFQKQIDEIKKLFAGQDKGVVENG